MSAERHERLSELFLAASELQGEARAALLDTECADDPELREEVVEMLEIGEASGVLDRRLEGHVWAELKLEGSAGAGATPESIGEYAILSVLGEGGMGTVYRARQRNPEREVALKVVRPGFATSDTLRRFEVEAQLLGRLRHPGIAQIHEAGVAHSEAGPQPFLVMELIEGPPIDVHARGIGHEARIELIARVADAVHHAHEKGVLHRDLKSSNVLVDESGQSKVLDFGVARAIDEGNGTMLTQTGQIVGTLATMAPEQVHGEADVRSDVYALGVIAYSVLAGRPPIDVSGLSIPDAARRIVEVEPRRLGAVDRSLRGDLETIVAKALSKDRNRRYSSAADLASDLRRHLRHEPVSARPPSSIYQLGRLARRNRAAFAGACIALASLVIGLLAALLYASRMSDAREESDDVVAFLASILRTAHPDDLGHKALVVDALDRAALQLDEEGLGDRPGVEARLQETLGNAYSALGLQDQARRHLELAGEILPRDEWPLPLLHSIARVHIEFAEYDEALALARELEARATDERGADDRMALTGRGIAVRALLALLRFEEAEEELDATLAESRRIGYEAEAFHYDLLEVRSELLRHTGRLVESIEPLSEVRELSLSHHGPTHSTTLAYRTEYAARLFELSRLAEADPLLTELVELCEQHLGEDASTTLNALEHLSMLRRHQSRLDESEALIETVIERRTSVFGPDHVSVLIASIDLANTRLGRGDAESAHELAKGAYEAALKSEGPSSMTTVTAALAQANSLYRLKRYEESESICGKTVEEAVDQPAASPVLLQVRSLRASALQQLKRLEEAAAILAEMMPLARKCFGEKHAQVYVFQQILGDVYRDQGDLELAEANYREALEGLEGSLGPNHGFTNAVRKRLEALE
ncbi:MAG: serine/threonine protein kinase [bacterium]|nr:serine/threonine protein kinase [bacterium]